jgi:outer membrane protein TolC
MILLALVLPASALTLEDAWRQVEARGEEAALLDEQQRQAALIRTQAWAALSPKVVVNGNWTLNQREIELDFASSFPADMLDLIEQFTGEPVDLGDPTVLQKKQFFDANITVMQPIFSGRALPALGGASALVRASEAQQDAGLATVRLGVARAFWGVVVGREGEAVARAALEVARAHEDTSRALVAAGSATRQAELQAAIGVARAQRELAAAVARRTQSESALAALVEGIDTAVLEPPESARSLPVSTVESAIERAAVRRPELAAAREQEAAMEAQRTSADLAWLPGLDARFTQAWTENAGLTGQTSNWLFVLNASWTPWDGGFRIAEQQRTASLHRQASAALDKVSEDVETEVRAAWDERARAREALDAARRELALADENLRLAEASHAAGASAYLDLEQARVGRDAARLAVVAERMNEDLASLALLRAIGDL